MDELLAKAAEAMGMPGAMVRRSAEARSKAESRSVEEILAEWAGVDLPSSSEASEGAAAPSAPLAVEATPAPRAAKAAATGVDKFVEMAGEKMAMPASMVRRSAEARARAEDKTYEAVIAEWAGVDLAEVEAAKETVAETPAAPEPTAAQEPQAAAPAEEPPSKVAASAQNEAKISTVPGPPAVEVIGGRDDDLYYESAVEPELAGVGRGMPRWLSALFIVGPAFAIVYAAFFPNGPNCGDAGQLAVDPVTGIAVECDGSAYGEVTVDFFGMGAELYESMGCAACHGTGGEGAAGPPFIDGELLATFPEGECAVHIDWVRLGTPGWPDPTYGANGKPVGGFGLMPGFGGSLSDEQLAAVSLYERVQFGGQSLEAALGDCGLAADGDSVPAESAIGG